MVRQAEGPQSSASAYLSSYDATCTEAPLSFASGGTVTITSVSGDHVAGTFDLRFDDDHISGTFDAPTCPGLAKIPTLNTLTCP